MRLAGLVLVLVAAAASAHAGTFGVPCMGVGAPIPECAGAANPPGFLILTTTGTATTSGDAVHQMRFFIEVTGTTLDIRVFDPGANSGRDIGGNFTTQYDLLNPAGTVVSTVSIIADSATTNNALVRFNCSTATAAFTTVATAGFFGSGVGTCPGALAAGVYELRIRATTATTTADRYNAFGIDVRDGSGNHYNVYTIGDSDTTGGTPSATETSLIAGALNAGTAPLANIVQPMVAYPYVNRGCSLQTSNFDMDTGAGNPGAGSSALLTDVQGATTALTPSGDATSEEDTVDIVPSGVPNLQALNYGIYTLVNNTGTQDNRAIDWRVADFTGGTPLGAGFPFDPASPIRIYLPNGINTAPAEPSLTTAATYVSGPNPPVVGSATRFNITASVSNTTARNMTPVALTIPIVAGAVFAGVESGSMNGTATACTVTTGAGFRRCTFTVANPLTPGSVASYNVQVDLTPSAAGLFNVTGAPAAGTPPPDTTVWAQYTPAFSSATFVRTENLGPACELAAVAYAPTANISVTKTDAPDPVRPGANLTYTIQVTNAGPNTAPGVKWADTLPAGTTFVSLTAAGYTCTTPPVGAAGTVSCARTASLALATDSATLVVRVASNAVAGSTISNTVSVSANALDGNTANNTATSTTTVAAAQADLALTQTDAPDPVSAGQDITYTIAVQDLGPSDAAGLTLTDVVPTNTTFQAVSAPGWSCTTPAVNATGTVTCTRSSLVAGASASVFLVVRVGGAVAAGTVISNTASVSTTTTDPVAGNNSAATTTTVAAAVGAAPALCATPGRDGVLTAATAETVVNTYYPVTASAAATATSLTLGAATGAASPIAAGDLLMVIQMQDAGIDSTNTGAYGDGVAGDPARGSTPRNSGLYELVVAQSAVSLAGGSLTLQGTGGGGGLINAYTNAAANATDGQRRFQVVRVPQYSSATFGPGLTALRWNGTTGGVLAVDVAGSLALGNATVSVTGRGFRGGGARQLAGGAGGTALDYRTAAANNFHGVKGEGIAGTPRHLLTAPTIPVTSMTRAGAVVTVTTLYDHAYATGNAVLVEGADQWEYNSSGTGATTWTITVTSANTFTFNIGALTPATPATGTLRVVLSTAATVTDTTIDGYPNGSQGRGAPGNAGGGGTDSDGTANQENSGGGGGGNGGIGGQGGNAWQSQATSGGFGGAAFANTVTRLALGGAGGAGTRNNSSGLSSAGGAGGGLLFVRAGTVTGTGTLVADGDPGWQPDNDGGGGGGAGGTILVAAASGGLGGLTVRARGGNGAHAWPQQAPGGTPGERHGPGGGGAGGFILFTSAPALIDVAGGLNGITTTANDAFGATPGAAGLSTTITASAIPGTTAGALCAADLSIVKTDAPDPVILGGTLTYSLLVTNNGFRTALGVSVTDVQPANVSFVSASASQGTCTTPSPNVTCSVGTLPTGGTATVTITATATGSPTITNTATVTATTPDPTTANNSSTAVTTVNPSGDLAVTLTGTPNPVVAGSTLTYTAVVSNNGPSTATTPTVTFPIPAGTTFESITPPVGWTCSGVPAVGGTGTITCSAASLANLGSAGFTIVTRVPLGTAPGTQIVATATVSAASADTVAANNQATAINTVDPALALLTRATLRGLRVDRSGRVQFATATQAGTASFEIYGTDDPSGMDGRVLLTREPVAALPSDSLRPTLYDVPTAPVTARFVVLEETDRRGRRSTLGPFPVENPRLERAFASVERLVVTSGGRESIRGGVRARSFAAGPGFAAALQPRGRVPGALSMAPTLPVPRGHGGLQILTRGRGRAEVYRSTLEANGLPPERALSTVGLYSQGQPVPFSIVNPGMAGERIVFQAEALHTTYTEDNVYVLVWAGRPPRLQVPLSVPEAPPAGGITRAQKPSVYVAAAPREIDPWFWDALSEFFGPAWPYADSPEGIGSFDIPGLVPGASGSVLVRVGFWLQGDVRHSLRASLNGIDIAAVDHDGGGTVTLEGLVPASALLAQGNALQVEYSGEQEGLAYLRFLDVAAPVDANALTATVRAFLPFDESVPPRLADPVSLIVSHGSFLDQARRLAVLKSAQGRRAVAVDVQTAYDRYSAGIVEANAVAALIREAARGGKLQEVVLFGDDTFDNADFLHLGSRAYVPSLLAWDDEFGRVPSENRYADVDEDGAPDLAIGRLPAQNPQEAARLVDKVARQQDVLRAAAGRQVFAVDRSLPGEPSFRAEAQAVAVRFPFASTTWVDVAQGAGPAQLGAALAGGAAVTNYFGHGAPLQWSNEALLTAGDAAALRTPESVFLVWACESQFFTYLWEPTVDEALLLNPQGGALAVFGPAGITDASAQAVVSAKLYAELASSNVSLGEAIRRAKAQAIAEDPRSRPVVEGWNLLGDPGILLKDLVGAPGPRPRPLPHLPGR